MALQVIITKDYDHMSSVAGEIVIPQIAAVTRAGKRYHIGLATGNSPVGLYKEMIRRQSEFNPALVDTANLDEYVIKEGHPESYRFFMNENLFRHMTVPFSSTHVPEGTRINNQLLGEAIEKAGSTVALAGKDKGRALVIQPNCEEPYITWIRDQILIAYVLGIKERGSDNQYPIHLWVAGSGKKGHIAFHESGIPFQSSSYNPAIPVKERHSLDYGVMVVKLDETTIEDAIDARHFKSKEEAPKYAISMTAMGVVENSQKVLLLTNGPNKVEAVTLGLLGDVTPDVPISILQRYRERDGDAIFIVDEIAAQNIIKEQQKLRDKGFTFEDRR